MGFNAYTAPVGGAMIESKAPTGSNSVNVVFDPGGF